jgi:hypothetical protein
VSELSRAQSDPAKPSSKGCGGCAGAVLFVVVVGGILVGLWAWSRSHLSELWRAAADGDLYEMRRLVDAGENINGRLGLHESTPLHAAAGNGQLEAAKYLLERGASVKARDDQGLTPLAYCAQFNGKGGSPRGTDGQRARIAEMLLIAGADINSRDDFGRNVLERAEGSPGVAAVLKAAMAKPTTIGTTRATSIPAAD